MEQQEIACHKDFLFIGGIFMENSRIFNNSLKEDEILPIVIPVGYPKKKERLIGSLMKTVVGSGNRKNFEDIFYNENFDNKLTVGNLNHSLMNYFTICVNKVI
jgi:hypothetical protein